MSKLRNNQAGFTILELMISTVVFSVMLLGAAAMLVQIGRMYYKGVVSSRTQEATRTIADDVTRAVQFSNKAVTVATPDVINTDDGQITVNAFCVGNTRYTYIINGQVKSSGEFSRPYEAGDNQENYVERALWRDQLDTGVDVGSTACEPADITNLSFDEGGKDMLGDGMRLYKLSAPTENASTGLVTFVVGVAYGVDNTILTIGSGTAGCTGSGLGAQWCSTSELTTNVFRRITE